MLVHIRVLSRQARANRRLVFITALSGLTLLAIWLRFVVFRDPISRVPDIYKPYYAAERAMPQHNTSLPYPEGTNGRYLFVQNQIFGLGWNNVFQELYMLAHLSYVTRRAFVYRPYTWDRGYSNFVDNNGRRVPSRIPETAILSGPIIGAPFPLSSYPEDSAPPPRAVSEEYFKSVCPPWRRRNIHIKELHNGLEYAEGGTILEHYIRVIEAVEEKCLMLWGKHDHPFDWRTFGDKQALSLWPHLRSSPILTHFSWSDTILSALRRNAALLSRSFSSSSPPGHFYKPILDPTIIPEIVPQAPTLMALHLRRGDFHIHCNHLANFSSTFMGWAQFPGLPSQDRFSPPPIPSGIVGTTRENRKIYMERCWPGIERIVQRVETVRRQWSETGPEQEKLTSVYIMTNGAREWVDELKARLVLLGGWESVTSSHDLELSEAQTFIAQSVDMAIAERAGVFVGNGFSSLTANVILLRLVKNMPMDTIRLW